LTFAKSSRHRRRLDNFRSSAARVFDEGARIPDFSLRDYRDITCAIIADIKASVIALILLMRRDLTSEIVILIDREAFCRDDPDSAVTIEFQRKHAILLLLLFAEKPLGTDSSMISP
jgi:hypothetical protein